METLWCILIGVVLLAIILIVILYNTNSYLQHKHQLTHEMASLLGQSWGVATMFDMWGRVHIKNVERIDINHERITFSVDAPGYGANCWMMTVIFDKQTQKYEQYCPLDSNTAMELQKVTSKMACRTPTPSSSPQ